MSEPRVHRDARARRRIVADLDATFFVEAAAGTGKTTELVGRIVALLLAGRADLRRIVALTFTEKAAGEMKLRLRGAIERMRQQPALPEQQRARLDDALAQLELAHIATIHAFCADLLRERPVEAGVDPLFEVSPEGGDARSLLDHAFDKWFQGVVAAPPEGVRRVLRRRPRGRGGLGPRGELRSAVESLVAHRDFDAAWRREDFARERSIDRVFVQLEKTCTLADLAANPNDRLARSFAALGRFVAEVRLREGVQGRDHDVLEADLRELARARHWTWKGAPGPYGADLTREAARAAHAQARDALAALLRSCDADLAPRLREELRPVVAAYEELKQRSGRLDFLDLLIRTRDLLRDDPSVRERFQRRFSHFFVDELQDTDPLQVEILLLLASDRVDESDWRKVTPVPGKLFLVGDPKQSIYRFRRADVAVYERLKRVLVDRGAEVLQLSTSFRALPALQQAVNAAFAPEMSGGAGGSQAAYVPLEPARDDVEARPALVALPSPRPYADYGQLTRWAIGESFPEAVGAFVSWLVTRSGWTVTEPGPQGRAVPVQGRHVCLLFRRFQSFGSDVTRPYVRALENRRLCHVLMGGRSFHEREEVLALRNALGAIEWPDDELRVFATLRGPLFALGDDALFAYRSQIGKLHPLLRPDPDRTMALGAAGAEVTAALEVLGRLHVGRNRRPIAFTLTRLLAAVRAHAGIAIWPTGPQALANCLRIIDVARRYERRGAPSFRAFVERLEEEAERGQSEDAPVIEEGTEGIRIMTVHRAKGLEFPVVILADPTAPMSPGRPSRHVDVDRRLWAEPLCGSVPPDLLDAAEEELRRDREEAVRLTYVAATRARDLLVVPTVGDADLGDPVLEGWLEVLAPVVYPDKSSRRASTTPPGCPPFGADSVLLRPDASREGSAASVRPGLHRPGAGEHRVVWWDPATLALEHTESVGLRQQRVLEADASGQVAAQGTEAHARWQAEGTALREAASRPTVHAKTVTALSVDGAAQDGAGPIVAVEVVPGDRAGRPRGRRFGSLVHAVLAQIELEADASSVRALAVLQGRLLGATSEEVAAAADAVAAALRHPLLRRAAQNEARGETRRESPLVLRLEDGTLAEGSVDLAFREEGSGNHGVWTVVDFKTDRELDGQRSRYEAQVRLYAAAITAATGERTLPILLIV